jgi:hypothetical protein
MKPVNVMLANPRFICVIRVIRVLKKPGEARPKPVQQAKRHRSQSAAISLRSRVFRPFGHFFQREVRQSVPCLLRRWIICLGCFLPAAQAGASLCEFFLARRCF